MRTAMGGVGMTVDCEQDEAKVLCVQRYDIILGII